jgi:hypothetical protein
MEINFILLRYRNNERYPKICDTSEVSVVLANHYIQCCFLRYYIGLRRREQTGPLHHSSILRKEIQTEQNEV